MAAQCGAAIVLSIENNAGSPAFEAIAGLRSRSITFNAEAVDVTNADSSNKWRELLDACGVKSFSVSGSGVMLPGTPTEEVREAFFAGSIRTWRLLIPGFGTVEADCKITSLEFGGEHNDAVQVSMSLESAGEPTWTAV